VGIECLAAKRLDPLLRGIELPLTGTWHPVGFRVNIATNSRHVLEAAEESWGEYGPHYDRDPMEFRVVIQPEGPLASEPSHRAQGHLYSVVSDANNFAHFDLHSLFGFFLVSARTASDHTSLRWFFVESMAYVLLAQRYVVPVHAACIARNGSGTLLCGGSGAGKSTLSYACARAGWTFITDDCTFLLTDSDARVAIGKPHQARFREDAPNLFPELAGYPISAHPGGKPSLEVPLSVFSQIRTALECPISRLVFLDRPAGLVPHFHARLEKMPSSGAIELLLKDMPSYGEEVDARHEKAVYRLLDLPAYCLRYQTLDDAIRLLSALSEGTEP
jgi:hypothetical protein